MPSACLAPIGDANAENPRVAQLNWGRGRIRSESVHSAPASPALPTGVVYPHQAGTPCNPPISHQPAPFRPATAPSEQVTRPAATLQPLVQIFPNYHRWKILGVLYIPAGERGSERAHPNEGPRRDIQRAYDLSAGLRPLSDRPPKRSRIADPRMALAAVLELAAQTIQVRGAARPEPPVKANTAPSPVPNTPSSSTEPAVQRSNAVPDFPSGDNKASVPG
jgi:hypothetical protein